MNAKYYSSVLLNRAFLLLNTTSVVLLFGILYSLPMLSALAAHQPARAASPDALIEEGVAQPTALCLPGIYLEEPEDCLPLGPSAHRTELARPGIQLPLRPLAAVPSDPDLIALPYLYAQLVPGMAVPIFVSLEDAIANANPVSYIAAGELRYISYIEEAYTSGGQKPDFSMLREGGWVAARDVAQRTRGANRFQGLVFRRTPERSFGWVLPLTSGWHRDQKEKALEDGSLELTFPVASYVEVMMEILRQGSGVKVLHPAGLGDLIRQEALKIADLYRHAQL